MAKDIITIKVANVVKKAVTVNGLAKIIGLSPSTIRKYEERGIFPPANYRIGVKNSGFSTEGKRIYFLETAEALKKLFAEKVRQGVPMGDDVKFEIKQIFAKEKEPDAT